MLCRQGGEARFKFYDWSEISEFLHREGVGCLVVSLYGIICSFIPVHAYLLPVHQLDINFIWITRAIASYISYSCTYIYIHIHLHLHTHLHTTYTTLSDAVKALRRFQYGLMHRTHKSEIPTVLSAALEHMIHTAQERNGGSAKEIGEEKKSHDNEIIQWS